MSLREWVFVADVIVVGVVSSNYYCCRRFICCPWLVSRSVDRLLLSMLWYYCYCCILSNYCWRLELSLKCFFYCCCISDTNTPGVHQHWSDTLAHKQPSDRIRYGRLKSFWYLQIWVEHPDFSMFSQGWSVCGEISSVRYFQPYLARYLLYTYKNLEKWWTKFLQSLFTIISYEHEGK